MIKKKYPANTLEIKKLSQQAIKGVFRTKNLYSMLPSIWTVPVCGHLKQKLSF